MSWQREVDELDRRRELARRMGGPEGIERQHERGKLTVRQRIDALGDPDSFRSPSWRRSASWSTPRPEGIPGEQLETQPMGSRAQGP